MRRRSSNQKLEQVKKSENVSNQNNVHRGKTKTPHKFTFMHEQLYSDKQGNRDKMDRERGVN